MAAVRPLRHVVSVETGRLRAGGRDRVEFAIDWGARLVVAALVATFLLAAALAGGDAGSSETGAGCLQRVKTWSPSRQATVVRLVNYCG